MGKDKFNSVNHYIYYCGQESHRRNEVAIMVNKKVRNAILGCNFKNRMISVRFQDQSFNITVIQVYVPTTNAEEAEVEQFYEDLQDLLENALVIANTLFQEHKRRLYTWTSPDGQYQIRLIIFFAAKDGEALYSQQKQDQELTVAQIMSSLLPNSDLN